MIDVWQKIQYGDIGSGDYVAVTIESLENRAIVLGNDSIHGNRRFVIYEDQVEALIEALTTLKKLHFKTE